MIEGLCYYRKDFGKLVSLKTVHIYTRCRMKINKSIQTENTKLLMDIVDLKIKLNDLYNSGGPNTSDYVTLKINLDCLMHEYFEEKIEHLM